MHPRHILYGRHLARLPLCARYGDQFPLPFAETEIDGNEERGPKPVDPARQFRLLIYVVRPFEGGYTKPFGRKMAPEQGHGGGVALPHMIQYNMLGPIRTKKGNEAERRGKR